MTNFIIVRADIQGFINRKKKYKESKYLFLNSNKIKFTIDYVGNASQLQLAFSQNYLDLSKEQEIWFLKKAKK